MVSCQLDRDWMNGIRLVRITWMIRVWVISDSTNQPVWNSAAAYVRLTASSRSGGQLRRTRHVLHLKRNHIIAKVV